MHRDPLVFDAWKQGLVGLDDGAASPAPEAVGAHAIAQRVDVGSPPAELGLPRPIFLFVGRVSHEKNLEAFLRLDLPGSRVVCGGGPLLERLRRRYPAVQWRGTVAREALVGIYNAADSFVFPSRTDTFGLVMLEALACGTAVAAFPVAGPLDVVGGSDGGALDDDLRRAALRSLEVPRARARARAMNFEWNDVCRCFLSYLVPVRLPGLRGRLVLAS